jgi:hypothetical protein
MFSLAWKATLRNYHGGPIMVVSSHVSANIAVRGHLFTDNRLTKSASFVPSQVASRRDESQEFSPQGS